MNRRNFFKAAAAGSAAACLLPAVGSPSGITGPIGSPGTVGPLGPVDTPLTSDYYDSVNARLAEARRRYAQLGHTVGSPQFEHDVNATLLGTTLCRP